jgi:ABC-2 type transport system permease protein
MRATLAIARNDIRLMARDRVALFFTVVFPLIVGLLFGTIFQGVVRGAAGEFKVTAALVDLDNSTWSNQLADRLDSLGSVSWQRFATVEEAQALVQSGDLPAAVVLPAGIGEQAENLFAMQSVRIEMIVDPSRGPEQATLRGLIAEQTFEQIFVSVAEPEQMRRMLSGARASLAEAEMNVAERAALLAVLGAAERWNSVAAAGPDSTAAGEGPTGVEGEEVQAEEDQVGFKPLDLHVQAVQSGAERPRPTSAYEITFPQAAGWALLGCVTGFGASLAAERTRGTLIRLEVAPIPHWQVLTGKALACFSTALVVQVLLLATGVIFLGVQIGSPWLLVMALLCSCLAFTGVMMLLAAVGGSAAGSDGLARGVLLVMALLGGAGVPLAFMPDWLRAAASISPFKWVILSLEGAIWRDLTFLQMLTPCGVLLGIGVGAFILGLAAFRWDASSD